MSVVRKQVMLCMMHDKFKTTQVMLLYCRFLCFQTAARYVEIFAIIFYRDSPSNLVFYLWEIVKLFLIFNKPRYVCKKHYDYVIIQSEMRGQII